jgi:hypothetical protein
MIRFTKTAGNLGIVCVAGKEVDSGQYRTLPGWQRIFDTSPSLDLVKYPLQLKPVEIDKLAVLFGCTSEQLKKLMRA